MRRRSTVPDAPAFALMVLGVTNPISECVHRIREDEPPPVAIADAAAPVVTANAVNTVVVPATRPTVTAVTTRPTSKPTPGPAPAPTPSPSPTPAPSPSPTPGRHLVFDTMSGTYGGLHPKAAAFITVMNAHAPMLKKCFATAGALSDAWSVSATMLAPKGGKIGVKLTVRHNGIDASDATAKSLEDCHRTTILQWPWPSTDDIEGSKDGPGYLNFGSGMVWRAN